MSLNFPIPKIWFTAYVACRNCNVKYDWLKHNGCPQCQCKEVK